MGSLKAIWKNGQVVLEGFADWPEGHRLIVEEVNPAAMEFMTGNFDSLTTVGMNTSHNS